MTSKRLDGIGEYYFSQKLREIAELNKAGKDIINLGIGSPDQPPHPEVIRVLQEESAKHNVHAYQSYKGSPVFRTAVADWYRNWYGVKLDPDSEILPLIGSKEGIMHICMTYFDETAAVLVPNPGYPTYNSAVKLSGALPVSYELTASNQYEPDLGTWKQLIAETDKKTGKKIRGAFINYPHMPTGRVPAMELFTKLVEFARENQLLLIHDNPYSFILNEKPLSLLAVPGAKEVALELNSLSKSHNMAGWRVGVLCGAREKIDEVLRFKSNMDSGMFLPVQLAAARALSLDKEWYATVNQVYRKRKEKVIELISAIGCSFNPEQAGMFVWAAVPDAVSQENPDHPLGSGGVLSDRLLYDASVFITPGGIFGSAGNEYIRVSLCSPEEKLEEAILRINRHGF